MIIMMLQLKKENEKIKKKNLFKISLLSGLGGGCNGLQATMFDLELLDEIE